MSKEFESFADEWVPSRFNMAVDLPRGRKAVFNSFNGSLVVITASTWRRYLKAGCAIPARPQASSDDVDVLCSTGLLVSKSVNELDLLRLRDQTARFNNGKLGVTVAPTLACNLSCRYCFESGVQKAGHGKTLTRDREDEIVRHIAVSARGKRSLDMSWFGGEPLLTAEAIARISSRLIPACDQAGVKYSAVLATNGMLLSRDVVRLLRECRLKFVQVTVDIPASEKRDRLGRDTAGQVLNNLVFAAQRLPVHLRINIVRDDKAGFDALYRQLIRRDLHRHLQALFFAYVFDPECGGRHARFAAMTYPAYARIAARERRKARALGLPVHADFRPTQVGCIATDRFNMVIGPDGRLFKCTEDIGMAERAYGSIEPGSPVKLNNLVPWLLYDGLQDPRCVRCPILAECNGGCPHIRRFQPGQLEAMRYCEGHLQEIKDRIREWATDHLGRSPRRSATIVEPGSKESADR
ncbi:MAG: radical SAM protein [Verrucomicrobia bacterium]|nr:radical SAM protein [Verrucomicrobiota bacterium]